MRHDVHPKVPKSLNFNVWWAHALSPSDKRWRLLMDFQRINHFPGTFVLGRKDRLTRCLARFRHIYIYMYMYMCMYMCIYINIYGPAHALPRPLQAPRRPRQQ